MPRLTILLLSLILGAGSAVLISCGGDDGPDVGIPSTNATQMLEELERARAHFEAGDSVEVEESAVAIQEQADGSLAEQGVDAEVREGIAEGAARLAELAQNSSECEEQETTTTTEDEDKTTTTEEEATTTTPPPTTTSTTTTTTEEPPPPDDGGDAGGGPPVTPPGNPGGTPSPGTGGTGGVGDGE